jgi:hypothetical protein
MKTADFERLNQAQRTFVDALARGEHQMSALLSQHTASIKDHVTSEAAMAVTGITRRLDDNAAQIIKQKLLTSLKYEAMNSRRNAVADAHAQTFEWIFKVTDDLFGFSGIKLIRILRLGAKAKAYYKP